MALFNDQETLHPLEESRWVNLEHPVEAILSRVSTDTPNWQLST
jgi:hypothetical protein